MSTGLFTFGGILTAKFEAEGCPLRAAASGGVLATSLDFSEPIGIAILWATPIAGCLLFGSSTWSEGRFVKVLKSTN